MAESPLAREPTELEAEQQLQAERDGMPFVLYRDEADHQHISRLEDSASRKITIGRAAGADIPLFWDEEVSRIHAEFERIGEDWAIVDDGLSRNGTSVNGRQVVGRRRLADGDVIRVGCTDLIFRSPWHGGDRSTVLGKPGSAPSTLSSTQHEVLMALSRIVTKVGDEPAEASSRKIAEELALSPDAVEAHLRQLHREFGTAEDQGDAQLVEIALRSGIVTPD